MKAPRRAPTTPRGWLQLARRQRNSVRGWFARPARQLLDLSAGEMANRLGVSEQIYLSWEADEETISGRKFGQLLRMLRDAGVFAAYFEATFGPLLDAESAESQAPENRQVTRSVPPRDES